VSQVRGERSLPVQGEDDGSLDAYHFKIWRSPYQARYPSDATAAAVRLK
jgi:hypothetical protein